jgi:hypothetical protein
MNVMLSMVYSNPRYVRRILDNAGGPDLLGVTPQLDPAKKPGEVKDGADDLWRYSPAHCLHGYYGYQLRQLH